MASLYDLTAFARASIFSLLSPLTKAFFCSSDNYCKLTFKPRISLANFLLSLSAYFNDEESTIPSFLVISLSDNNLLVSSSMELVKDLGALPFPHKSLS
jgi:hypothetical protein